MVVDRQLGLVTVLGSQVREVNLEGTWLGDTKQRPQLEEAEDGAFTAGWQHSLFSPFLPPTSSWPWMPGKQRPSVPHQLWSQLLLGFRLSHCLSLRGERG